MDTRRSSEIASLALSDQSATRVSIAQERLILPLLYPYHVKDILAERDIEAPPDCPVGLEPLADFENLLVIRRPENQTSNLPLEQRFKVFSQYDIINTKGDQLFIAVEKTNARTIFWMRDARLFNLTMYDHDCRRILSVRRKWGCFFCFAQYYCCLCVKGFHGGGNTAEVTLAEDDSKMGRIVQRCSLSTFEIVIYDKTGSKVMAIKGKLLDSQSHEGMFDVYHFSGDYGSVKDPIAMVETLMSPNEVLDFYKIKIAEYEDPYGITFFTPKITPEHKTLLLCAVLTMDFIFCKPNSDYPHWLQFIPVDFSSEMESHVKIFKDGSKEIIVTTTDPNHEEGANRRRRSCSCCRWFWGFLCLCCPLGMARNALRCIHLIVFATALLFLASLGLCFAIWNISFE